MDFVPDNTLDRTYGADLMAEIRASIHPTGACAICQQPLSNRPVRIKAYGPGHTLATFVPTHASCGPSGDAGAALLSPPLTWETAWLLRGIESRDTFGFPVHADMPVIVLNPSVDVHSSNETRPGVWSRPIDLFHQAFKFARAVDQHPSRLPQPPYGAAVTRTDHELRIDMAHTWVISIDSRFIDAVDHCSGFLLAVSHRITPQMLMTDPVDTFDELVSPEGNSAFAWIPSHRITTASPITHHA